MLRGRNFLRDSVEPYGEGHLQRIESAVGAHEPRTLETLLIAYQRGDAEAVAELIRAVNPLLYRYFRWHPGMREEAPDLLQEAWLRIHKARATYQAGRPARPWLYAIARYTLLDAMRRKSRQVRREISLNDELDRRLCPSPESVLEMRQLVERLPAGQQEVLRLLKVDGLTLEEAAELTQSSVGSVKQRAHRAYQRLRELFSAEKGSTKEEKQSDEL